MGKKRGETVVWWLVVIPGPLVGNIRDKYFYPHFAQKEKDNRN